MARFVLGALAASILLACGGDDTSVGPATDGGGDATTNPSDASADAGDASPSDCAGTCPQSNIRHLVLIIQENHTFDTHFGGYCTADAGSSPTCNTGPGCCEAMPATDPMGIAPTTITDAVMASRDPNHSQACEQSEIDDGGMDKFGSGCGSPANIAIADPTIIKPYWDLAAQGALADRYFQPVIGQSSSNDMYLARAQFVFLDNAYGPQGAIGIGCALDGPQKQFPGPTIVDLLAGAGASWAWYGDGLAVMEAAVADGGCPAAPAACGAQTKVYPCNWDPADNPFEYYASTVNSPSIQDFASLSTALGAGTLPAVAYVKAIGYKSEHPGYGDKLSDGVTWVTSVIDAVEASPYASDTLVLLTYDEGGGYFDHVPPPPANPIDMQGYGTRIPLLAAGPFAKKGYVSHVVMEHSSIVKFIEWNWLRATGQLAGRDTNVANIGDLLDPATTGATVPSN